MSKPKYKITVRQWDKMFATTIEENKLRDLRQDQDVGEAAFSLTHGTVSSPLTQVGKYNLGRAVLTKSPSLDAAKAFVEKYWPGEWATVMREVDLWLNPPEPIKPKPLVDERKYVLPCLHRTYHLDPGPRGLVQCFQTGCNKRFKVSTDKTGKVSLVEFKGGAVGA